MAKLFLNVSNHALTKDQLEEIQVKGFSVMELEEDMKKAWGSMNPSNWRETCDQVIRVVLTYDDLDTTIETALVAGYTPAVVYLTNELSKYGTTPLYAHTDRVSVEKTNEDGTVTKTNIFKHSGFYNIISGERW